MRRIPLYVSSMLVLLLGATVFPSEVQAITEYHTQKGMKHETVDVTLNWDISRASAGWQEFTLWENWLTDCFISFKYGLDATLQVPARLDLSFPDIVEPGEDFEVTASLNLVGTRVLTISPEFFLKIDMMLPAPIWLPNVGLIRHVRNTFGGKWTFSFSINSQHLGRLLDQIFLGDPETMETYSSDLSLPSFVQIKRMSYNPNTLGELVSGEVRVDFLDAILEAAEMLSIVNPMAEIAVQVLRWLVQEVFNTSTGLLITPRLSARIDTPIVPDAKVSNLGLSSLEFGEDISTKVVPALLSSTSRESGSGNLFSIDLSPFIYRLFFDVDWDYYFDINLDVLGVSLYENTWFFDLFRFPTLSWDALNVKQRIPCTMKLDEPLAASDPTSEDGTVSLQIDDRGGIDKVELMYSTDKSSWQTTKMKSGSSTYHAAPSVPEETPIYYFVRATDGDGDVYELNNDGSYFSYILPKAQPPPSEQTPAEQPLEWFAKQPLVQQLSKTPTMILVSIPIAIVVVAVAIVAFKKKSRAKTPEYS